MAHVARPAALAKALDPSLYEVHFASDSRYRGLIGTLPFVWHTLNTIASERFLDAVAKAAPVYDIPMLHAYIREDLALIKDVDPELVVGDFRLSLAVSTQLAGIPYMAITNAYWSPYARLNFPVPDLPITRVLGVRAAQGLFNLVRPLAFAYHALPLDRVRRHYGLPGLGLDLRRTYTYADYTLYSDIPELVPTSNLPSNHHYLGPVLWSPAVSFPAWWHRLSDKSPVVYVTLGSSGRAQLLSVVLEALADLPITVLGATAGRAEIRKVPENAFLEDYLPGTEVSARASLVICNGGSPTTQQSLATGTPVLGLVGNMDQCLNMDAVQRAGAGKTLHAAQVNPSVIRDAVIDMLSGKNYKDSAEQLSRAFGQYNAETRFNALLESVLKIGKNRISA